MSNSNKIMRFLSLGLAVESKTLDPLEDGTESDNPSLILSKYRFVWFRTPQQIEEKNGCLRES